MMNEMMRENMKRALMVLVTMWILIALIVPKAYLKSVFGISLLIGIAFSVYLMWKTENRKKKAKPKMQVIDVGPDYKKLFVQQTLYRIRERIQAKFPDVVVELSESELQKIACEDKTIYTAVKNAEHYTHMSVALAKNGDLILNMFSLVNLDMVHQTIIEPQDTIELDDQLEQWFERKGQQLLTELLTNMNSRGYSKISINEEGEVMVREDGRNCVKDFFKEIPPKKDWQKLKELMSKEGVNVQVSARYLKFAW